MQLTLDVNVNFNLSGELAAQLVDRLGLIISAINSQNGHHEVMTAALDHLSTEVAETKEVMASAATLLAGLSAEIRALKDDPVALEALATDLDAATGALAAAVVANTPAEEPPVEEPPVEEPPVDEEDDGEEPVA